MKTSSYPLAAALLLGMLSLVGPLGVQAHHGGDGGAGGGTGGGGGEGRGQVDAGDGQGKGGRGLEGMKS